MVASHTREREGARAEHSAVCSANQAAHPPPCAKGCTVAATWNCRRGGCVARDSVDDVVRNGLVTHGHVGVTRCASKQRTTWAELKPGMVRLWKCWPLQTVHTQPKHITALLVQAPCFAHLPSVCVANLSVSTLRLRCLESRRSNARRQWLSHLGHAIHRWHHTDAHK